MIIIFMCFICFCNFNLNVILRKCLWGTRSYKSKVVTTTYWQLFYTQCEVVACLHLVANSDCLQSPTVNYSKIDCLNIAVRIRIHTFSVLCRFKVYNCLLHVVFLLIHSKISPWKPLKECEIVYFFKYIIAKQTVEVSYLGDRTWALLNGSKCSFR